MAVKIRLTRLGNKKAPFYRVVVADAKNSRDGMVIEKLGTFNPLVEPVEIKLDAELTKKWLSNGAQPTETARNLLIKAGILQPSNKKSAPRTGKHKKVEEKSEAKKTEAK